MKSGEPRSTGDAPAKHASGVSSGGRDAPPERVDWSEILEQRLLVPDSEETSPIAVPAAAPPRRRWVLPLVVAAAALFSVAAGAAVLFSVWRSSREERVQAPMPASATPPAGATVPAAATPPAAATSPAAPTQPTVPAAATPPAAATSPAAPTQPVAAPMPAEATATEVSTSADLSASPVPSPAMSPAPTPPSPAVPDASLPETPSRRRAARALEAVEARIQACGKENGVSGLGRVKMKVEPDGRIASSRIREGGKTFKRCVARVLRDVQLPPSQLGGTLSHEFTLPGP